MYLTHISSFNPEKTSVALGILGTKIKYLLCLRFIFSNMLAYSPTGRSEDGGVTWKSQVDQTRSIIEFEHLAFREIRKAFSFPLHIIATLDDGPFGTRAVGFQVNMLSAWKAEKEFNSADSVFNALFRMVLGIRFRRQGESQTESVSKLLANIFDESGEESLNGCIIKADRGYGSNTS